MKQISKNSWKVYESAVASFENFRLYCNLSNIWPVPLTDIVNFIAYLEKMNYEVSTAKSYISGFKNIKNSYGTIVGEKSA
jgi:hypothetical protein